MHIVYIDTEFIGIFIVFSCLAHILLLTDKGSAECIWASVNAFILFTLMARSYTAALFIYVLAQSLQGILKIQLIF